VLPPSRVYGKEKRRKFVRGKGKKNFHERRFLRRGERGGKNQIKKEDESRYRGRRRKRVCFSQKKLLTLRT